MDATQKNLTRRFSGELNTLVGNLETLAGGDVDVLMFVAGLLADKAFAVGERAGVDEGDLSRLAAVSGRLLKF